MNTFAKIAMIWVEPQFLGRLAPPSRAKSSSEEAGGRHSCLPVHADHAKSGRQECLPPALVSVPGRSARGEFGDHIRLAVLSARELIGGVGEVSGEAAFVGVEGDPRAERGGVGFEIDTIFS